MTLTLYGEFAGGRGNSREGTASRPGWTTTAMLDPAAFVAEPRLWVLAGPPGSGKSTLAAELAAVTGAVALSLDAQRAELSLWGDEADQYVTPHAVRAWHHSIASHLDQGQSVIADATNCVAEHREQVRQLATRHGARSTLVIVLPPLQTCLARNARRSGVVGACGWSRRVPDAVVTQMHASLTADVPRLCSEGWHEVLCVESALAV